MKWCTISVEYLEFIRGIEPLIPFDNYSKIREDGSEKKLLKPFFHTLYEKDNFVYVGQVNHYQPRHNSLQEDLDFKKIYDLTESNRALCVVNLNYMFPVPKTEIVNINYSEVEQLRDFDTEREKTNYILLLKKELRSINSRNLAEDAKNLYNLKIEKPEHRVSKRTFDFNALEQKCLEWIAAKQSTAKTTRHLTEQELLDTNKKIRYDGVDPSELIDASFVVDKEEYKIKDLELLHGKTKDMALLERTSDGSFFQDNDFASQCPLKLNLTPVDKSDPKLVKPKTGKLFSK